MNYRFLLKLIVTILLLALLGLKVDWERIRLAVGEIRLLTYAAAYLVLLVGLVPLALRLRVLMEPTKISFSLGYLIRVHLISLFYGMFLPSGVGIAIARWYQITRNGVGRRLFAVITLIERAMLTLTLLLCAGVPLLFVGDERIMDFRSSALPVIFIMLAACGLFFSCLLIRGVYRNMALLMQWAQSRFDYDSLRKLFGAYEYFGLYMEKRPLLFKALVMHLVFQAFIFVRFYLVFASAGVEIDPLTVLWVSMLILLVVTIPVSLGGVGVREAGFAWLLGLYGVEPEKGMLVGVLLSLQVFFNAGIGAALNMLDAGKYSYENEKA
jgi:uncharacterized protein (TIRG00374 family)